MVVAQSLITISIAHGTHVHNSNQTGTKECGPSNSVTLPHGPIPLDVVPQSSVSQLPILLGGWYHLQSFNLSIGW